MNSLIDSGVFITTSGSITGIKDEKVIDTTTDDLYYPPQGLGGQCAGLTTAYRITVHIIICNADQIRQ